MFSSSSRGGGAFRATAAMLVAAGAGVAGYALGIEPYRLQVVRVDIVLPRLPRALDGLCVLLLADLHTDAWGRRERALARLLDEMGTPDLTLLAGDLLQGARGLVPVCQMVERHVRARYGTYAIWGNAEHKPGQETRDALRTRLERAGVRVLINENETLTLRGETITVAGTDDPYYGHADLQRTLAGWDPAQFCLLLAHSPQIAMQAFRAGVDLMVSGHTHGGQVRLPFVGALKTQNPLSNKLDRGLWDAACLNRILNRDVSGRTQLYITRGVGVARFRQLPLYPRLLCRPEVTWITLRACG